MKSFIIAFSMYSRIPMPRVEWNQRSMKYSMCFFPFVGAVLGLCSAGVFYGLRALNFQGISVALILTALPILLTGGIHMDGYLDTMDAKNSWKSQEEKLQILKDPHMGAFACICGIVYLLLNGAFLCEVGTGEIVSVAFGYVYSRILSGLSVVTFRKAKKDGMVAESAKASAGAVKWILLAELAVCMAAMILICPLYGVVSVGMGLLGFLWYRHMAYKTFGGTTGDLAGYFLQICELMILIGIIAVSKAAALV